MRLSIATETRWPGSVQRLVRRPGLKYFRTVRTKRDGGETRTHLEGIGDSYTLCGLDTAGDETIHGKPPTELPSGKHRITCEQCLQVIAIVREHLGTRTPNKD